MSSTLLLERLGAARSFEDAAVALLTAVLHVTTASLAGSRFTLGRVLRAVVHLRPGDGYRGLVALDVTASGALDELKRSDSAYVPSSTAWRFVAEQGRSVAIDVVMGDVATDLGSALDRRPTQKLEAKRSQAILIEREVTHLFVAPLRAPGGRIDGMIAIEASCRQAIGEPFIWAACGTAIEAMAAMAAPYLSQLPGAARPATAPDELLPVVGTSMQPLVEMLRVFAGQEETILLGGATGAGKTRLARWCHENSPAKKAPFEVLDLATVPEDLQMAELFGWRKGAFTGAAKDTAGSLTRAEGGTLFVDEIDKLSLRAQSGLLRVLEEKKYRPLGESSGDRDANVRFIIGTNADLLALTKKGAFREDLYYRINVLPVRIPSLRERRDEIVDWVEYMLRRRHTGDGSVSLSPEGARLFAAHDWPGNLRQLDNIVRRAYALSLIKRAPGDPNVTLGEDEVRKALEYEGSGESSSVWDHLERAAEAFVLEAEARVASGAAKLDVDVAEALKGLIIEAARRRLGGDEKESVRRAFVLLGKEATVESRNHAAYHRRELDKIDEARRAFGLPPLPALPPTKKK